MRARLLGQQLLSRPASTMPRLDLSEFTAGRSLTQVCSLFSQLQLQQSFPDAATRSHVLSSMRTAYCHKMLEECGIPPAAATQLADPGYLPRRQQVTGAFNLELPQVIEPRAEANLQASMAFIDRAMQKPAASRTFIENYWCEFGPVTFSPLFAWCEDNGVFEVLTVEYVEALATYLSDRQQSLPAAVRGAPILEVGAGSGKLSHMLNATNKLRTPVVATDDGSWALDSPFEVLQIESGVAVAQVEPSIVMCSWMPENIDFSAAWRQQATVQEYILVGSPDSGLSGLPWETWGFVNPHLPEGVSSDELCGEDPRSVTLQSFQRAFEADQQGLLAPCRADGFERVRVDASRHQICRRDMSVDAHGHSETHSFRRVT